MPAGVGSRVGRRLKTERQIARDRPVDHPPGRSPPLSAAPRLAYSAHAGRDGVEPHAGLAAPGQFHDPSPDIRRQRVPARDNFSQISAAGMQTGGGVSPQVLCRRAFKVRRIIH